MGHAAKQRQAKPLQLVETGNVSPKKRPKQPIDTPQNTLKRSAISLRNIKRPLIFNRGDILRQRGLSPHTRQINTISDLRKALEKARTANLTKARFMATMSHELRTPLNAILGFSDIMKQELFGPLSPSPSGAEKYKEYIETIHEAGLQLLSLVNDVLDISRIETDKYPLCMDDVVVSQIVDQALVMLRQQAIDKGQTILLTTPNDPLPPIMGDRRALLQILLNIVGNALKFTPRDGTIHATIRGSRMMNGRPAVAIRISDTGIGIPERFLSTVLEPFEQASTEPSLYKKHFNGVGLGLAISHKLVENHGGSLHINSIENKGTDVMIRFPLKDQQVQFDLFNRA